MSRKSWAIALICVRLCYAFLGMLVMGVLAYALTLLAIRWGSKPELGLVSAGFCLMYGAGATASGMASLGILLSFVSARYFDRVADVLVFLVKAAMVPIVVGAIIMVVGMIIGSR